MMIRAVIAVLPAFLVVGPAAPLTWSPPPNPSTPTLTETLEWLRVRMTDERTDNVGLHIRTAFEAEGCRVRLSKTVGAVLIHTASFSLPDIGSVDVVEGSHGTEVRWTDTYLKFRAVKGEARITQGEVASLADPGLHLRPTPALSWHLGAVPSGSSTAENRELGMRLRKAFVHAVELCGGAITKEPF
jgi:hypothetical protein